MRMKRLKILTCALFFSGAMLSQSMADPFTITSQLIGDPRPNNPDDIIVDVTITGDTTSNTTSWNVDINSPLHPDIFLGAFFFNLDVGPTNVTFGNFDPSTWFISYPATNAAASGGADFEFVADSTSPGNNVTNNQDLTFDATLASGVWNEDIFLDAQLSMSNDDYLGSFQLGAHLQSLGKDGEDSGFAVGNYGGNGEPVPEPMTMLLLGSGLAGLTGIRMRKKL